MVRAAVCGLQAGIEGLQEPILIGACETIKGADHSPG
jgi:hypothetical protein